MPGTRATVAYRIESPEGLRDRVIGELHSLGTLGVDERSDALVAYFARPLRAEARRALAECGARVGDAEEVRERDWTRAWRAGLAPRRVGPLWIRPTWCAPRGEPELVLDPGQAFGSGEHASTRLALELLLETLRPGDRVLDLGTGSGILGLAALRLGAAAACGLDPDPDACAAARENARRNRLSLGVARATLAALGPVARYEVSVANLLWSRLEPELEGLAAHTRRALIVAGYLAAEAATVRDRAAACGWLVETELNERQSGDRWCAVRLAHTRARQSSSSSRSVSSSR